MNADHTEESKSALLVMSLGRRFVSIGIVAQKCVAPLAPPLSFPDSAVYDHILADA